MARLWTPTPLDQTNSDRHLGLAECYCAIDWDDPVPCPSCEEPLAGIEISMWTPAWSAKSVRVMRRLCERADRLPAFHVSYVVPRTSADRRAARLAHQRVREIERRGSMAEYVVRNILSGSRDLSRSHFSPSQYDDWLRALHHRCGRCGDRPIDLTVRPARPRPFDGYIPQHYYEWHRLALPEWYGVYGGHRSSRPDRHWIEYCGWTCREPLGIIEEKPYTTDENLLDQRVRFSRRVAEIAHVEAYLVGCRTDLSGWQQAELDDARERLRSLERSVPLTGFWVKDLYTGVVSKYAPSEMVDWYRSLRDGHLCGGGWQEALELW